MTPAEGGDPAGADDRPRVSPVELAVGLGAAFVWAAITLVRLGTDGSVAALFIAFCCASSSAVPVVIASRLLRGSGRTVLSVVLSALLSLVPVAVFAGLIQTRTHHRALGAVTFAAGAAIVLVAALLVVQRIIRDARAGRLGRLVYGALVVAGGVSAAAIIGALVGPGSPPRVRDAAVDAMVGVLSIFSFTKAPSGFFPRPLLRAMPGLLVVAIGVGAVAAAKNGASFDALCGVAPFALGIFGIFGCR